MLIKGDKGTGKSTIVRSMSYLLPEIERVKDCPFNCHPEIIELMCESCHDKYREYGKLDTIKRKMEIVEMPVSATEDMVIGTIDIKKVLEEGDKKLEPGILARANRNILYIDEVNLLDDHLVNVLLDCAAMGVNIVEREGISVYHPSRFILIGTMNPEEGDLRPQILDRFGLCVDVRALESKDDRLQIMKFIREFNADPCAFEKKFSLEQEKLQNKIIEAQKLLKKVKIPQKLLEMIVDITIGLGIKTHRADIVMEKTSKVLAAFDGRNEVVEDDIKEAAILALKHRIKQLPFQNEEEINSHIIENIINSNKEGQSPEEIFDFERNRTIKKDITKQDALGAIAGNNDIKVIGDRGKYIKAKKSTKPKNIAIDATIRNAIAENGKIEVLPENIMEKVRISNGDALYIILIDSSSSMRMEKKIRFAKTLSWMLLKQSYEKRNRIALISFRGDEAEVLAYPTSDVKKVEESLSNLPTGGKTPLTPAIFKATEMAAKEKKVIPTIIVISDGRCNVFIKSNLEEDLKSLLPKIKNLNVVFVNAEAKNKSIGILEDISHKFNAPCFYLEEIV